jgi:uncharacterized cupredoxin-like copper-binding protein
MIGIGHATRAFAIALAALVVTSCAGTAPIDPEKGRIIEITMTEFGFSPRTVNVTAGEKVTLKLKNAGTLEHEFMVGRAPVPGRGYAEDWLRLAVPGLAQHTHPGEQHLGEGVRVSTDWINWVTLVVPPETGNYEFGCFIAGHYEAGMKGTLIVR